MTNDQSPVTSGRCSKSLNPQIPKSPRPLANRRFAPRSRNPRVPWRTGGLLRGRWGASRLPTAPCPCTPRSPDGNHRQPGHVAPRGDSAGSTPRGSLGCGHWDAHGRWRIVSRGTPILCILRVSRETLSFSSPYRLCARSVRALLGQREPVRVGKHLHPYASAADTRDGVCLDCG